MNSRKLSLRHAKQYRTCPPPDLAKDPSQKEYITRHLAGCPYCSAEEFNSLKFWQETAYKTNFPSAATESLSDQNDFAAGQIRLIKPEYGSWVDGLFYSPPWVMILDVSDDRSGGLQVAQIYHDITLAGPGDLILEAQQTGLFDLLVECWNTYTLKSDYLGPAVAGVSAEIVAAVKQMEEDGDTTPEWAMRPIPLTEHDPRAYFRELEVEVSYRFASRAVAEILAEIETPRLKYASTDDLKTDIIKTASVIHFKRKASNFDEIIASAQFPLEEYAKAAADDDRESLPANMVVLWDGRVTSFRPTQGIVTSKMRTESSYNISGAFPLIPDNAINPRMICIYWSTATGSLIPDDMHWEVDTGSFYAKIHTDLQDDEVVEFALVYESEEEDGE